VDYSRAEAAQRAGVGIDELDQMLALGILHAADGDRFTPGEIRKAGLLHNLVASGLPLAAIGDAITSGKFGMDFLESPIYERFSALTDVTFAQLSERTGVPVELLMVIREATGGSVPGPDDRLRETELDIVPFLEAPTREGLNPAGLERLLRVQGDGIRRMAETEAQWWAAEVIAPAMAADKSWQEMTNPAMAEGLAATIDRALIANYHTQQAREWTRNIIEGLELVLAQAGIYGRVEHPPAMCFLDITGYTRLTDERGDAAAAGLAEQLSRMVQRTSVQHGGKPVKWLGDGVMFWFRDPGPGVVAALDMADGVVEAGLPPAHVGLHAGPVVFQEGDYYGQTVNIASRIADYARPGEVLVSQAVVEASGDGAAGATFADIGEVELKGVGGTVHLLAARRA
jgi:adenylate cyclase